MKLQCTLDDVRRSYIPNIYIWSLSCGDVAIEMDIHRIVAIFRKGDKLEVEISETLPPFEKGKDFAAQGYVITKRSEGNTHKLLISLWGFLMVLRSSDEKKFAEFSPMDHIYVVIRKST